MKELLETIVTSPLFYVLLGMVVGMVLKWGRGFVKDTENPYDDVAVEGLIALLKVADEEFDDPHFDKLFDKALDILEEAPETEENAKLKEVVAKK